MAARLGASISLTRAVQGEPRDAAVNFDFYRILQRHHALSVPQHGFLVGLCLQTAVNYMPTVTFRPLKVIQGH